LQNLNRAANLVVAADDRIELSLFGAFGQIDRVFLERLPGVLRIRINDLLATA
jgi:hypothetical protein